MKLKVELSDELIIDIIVTALEGGSNYWYWIEDFEHIKNLFPPTERQITPRSIIIAKAIVEKKAHLKIYEIDDNNELLGILNEESIKEAFLIMSKEYPMVYSKIIIGEYDASDADVFFQLAVMKKLVYG